MFNSNAKKKAIQRLEMAQKKMESASVRANEMVQSLYEKKKEAVIAIEKAERILKKQPDFNIDDLRIIADAKASIRLFKEAIQNEQIAKSITDSSGSVVGAGAAGVAAGAAVATFGPTAAMALATTFGTATTGTAISALSGAAATNAALAWLGGGSLAVGGGGMAAGSAFLALLGPIGWGIGGIAVGSSMFLVGRKNNKIAQQANQASDEIEKYISRIESSINRIKKTRDKINADMKTLEELTTDKELSSDSYPCIIQCIKSICKNINKKFTL